MPTHALRDLYERLVEDEWRREVGFSEDIARANAILFHPFSSNADREEVLRLWLQQNQPCLFGRVAAAQKTIHYCVLTDDDLRSSDEEVAEHIREEILAWKRRSVRPAPEVSLPAHSFLLVVASQRVCLAQPNETLRQLALKVLELWGCRSTNEEFGLVHWESLFLEHPATERYYRFSISTDYFAAQGDKRWWHDHRIPGGFAFTANATGHMRYYREWYEGKTDQQAWTLATAMGTIAIPPDPNHPRITWLRDLQDGKPLVRGVQCPFENPEQLKDDIKSKDWTRYAGHIHTDLSVRDEFFSVSREMPKELSTREYLLDLTYLYDLRMQEHLRLIEGEVVSLEEVAGVIGEPDTWVQIVSPRRRRRIRAGVAANDRQALARLLEECNEWALSPSRLQELSAAKKS